MTKVSASILNVDKENAVHTFYDLETTKIDFFHIDVMDGKFVEKKTFDHRLVDYCRNLTGLLLDVHLMVKNPEKVIDKYLQAGADIITVHFEAFKD